MIRAAFRSIETAQIRYFGASIVSVAFRTPVLLLHTTGRRSGLERTTPLAFHRDPGGAVFVVGGARGQSKTPDWVANLRARPAAAVTIQRTRFDIQVEELKGEERLQAWSHLATVWPRIENYQRKAGRQVPVFRIIGLEV